LIKKKKCDERLHFRQHFDAAMEKFLTNYKGPPSKKCKTDEEVRQRKQEYDRSIRIREFQPQWLTMFEWLEYHITNGVCKICRMYECIGTFITGCRTFKIESIRSHND
jgi:hypothetical protein